MSQLEFSQAMTDFKVMFPDVDADVIEAVLRANNGAVDMTIDHLLAMSADNEADKPPAYSGQPPSYSQATKEEQPTEDLINLGDDSEEGAGAVVASNSAIKHAYSHPIRQEAEKELHEMYEENLRLSDDSTSLKCQQQQVLEDERFALMLQNEEFMAELRRDTEFMSTLDLESCAKTSSRKADNNEEHFREKLKNMGKSSKKKFAQLAAIFSNSKGQRAKKEPLVNEDEDSEDDENTQKTPTKGKYKSFS